MPPLQTVDQIIASSTHPVYVIGWNRSPERGDPESAPRRPLRATCCSV